MLKGIGASSGIGIGRAVLLRESEPEIIKREIAYPDQEAERFLSVLEETKEETQKMAGELAQRVGEEEAAILNAHVMLMSDPSLVDEILKIIKNDKLCAEYAIESICDQYAMLFASMDDELMQQRAADMKDIKMRLVKSLLGIKALDLSRLPEESILVAEDLTPSMTAGLDPKKVRGILTKLGGRTSHSAILSRALEIPAVVAVHDLIDQVKEGDLICFDGESAEVHINPEAAKLAEFEGRRADFLKEKKELEFYKGKTTVTMDGMRVELAANIGNPEDAKKALEYDAEGIGLFRTEFLFMDRNHLPTEEEQFLAYKEVAALMQGKPVIIRTLDIGGDKEIPYMNIEKDENPFLGYRAVRLCLDRKDDLYKPQLRALLRASAFGDIRIMVPFVSCVEEFRAVKALIRELMKELDAASLPYNKETKIGIMVETAAASLIADLLAKEVDFFSIGTNDLTQYTMAVDRGNIKVSYLYSTYHPAVLRSIRNIIFAAKEAGITVGMCGEAASDPKMIPLLLAWGLDEFSMSASAILRSRKQIMACRKDTLKEIADKALSFATEEEVRKYLEEVC
ncbi:MAG: phosphoenolpyruvate--protein phosphotransferase [Johnsonella sp.]|nr:phosphoenolpyruvate--protein phosphotransferase [Johnsonella sp.]